MLALKIDFKANLEHMYNSFNSVYAGNNACLDYRPFYLYICLLVKANVEVVD